MVGEAQVEYINHLAYLPDNVLEKLPKYVAYKIQGLPVEYSIKVDSKLPGSSAYMVPLLSERAD